MTIASMTGFARAEGTEGDYAWAWEAKSVNARGLDVRCRVPPGTVDVDLAARDLAAKRFKRGNITLGLTLKRLDRTPAYRVNRDLLDQLVAAVRDLGAGADGLAPPGLDGLLSVRGVVEAADTEEDGDARKQLTNAILAGLETALDDLAVMRGGEGRALAAVLDGLVAEISRLCGEARALAETQPQAIRARLDTQIAELLERLPALPEERLAQEAAVLITKQDIREELDRLASHIDAARRLLGDGGAIGRKLDFLCQEFNRETNTICSKSSAIALTNIGLELKAVIEQFREQVQNIE